ncbi:hypothetical protein EJ05DRAFT_487044 [Pseudovirgaria hyperparasitica]|uniref:Uncharacterized protein n=1 Tax=Pseudovirgaria hyperparasitica TaxID=470096 RepID=A0A6A6W4T7_9PEZI|nr:uncharacterized protein EJ05DRAFT_487044 [Pseudovirgaria hyperparasitica]KAF2757054.1 hypothetical protein EJ05DRAFT_487044 [Pseudovirgaria hyperparasitica]
MAGNEESSTRANRSLLQEHDLRGIGSWIVVFENPPDQQSIDWQSFSPSTVHRIVTAPATPDASSTSVAQDQSVSHLCLQPQQGRQPVTSHNGGPLKETSFNLADDKSTNNDTADTCVHASSVGHAAQSQRSPSLYSFASASMYVNVDHPEPTSRGTEDQQLQHPADPYQSQQYSPPWSLYFRYDTMNAQRAVAQFDRSYNNNNG